MHTIKYRSFSKEGRLQQAKQDLNRTSAPQTLRSSIGQSRDEAIKYISHYSGLMDVYGSSRKLTEYMILNRGRLVEDIGQRKIESGWVPLNEQIKRLDQVKVFNQVLGVEPNNKKLDEQLVSHLTDLKQIYPSLNENQYLHQHNQVKQDRKLIKTIKPDQRLARGGGIRKLSETDDTYDLSCINMSKFSSVPRITKEFFKRRKLISSKSFEISNHSLLALSKPNSIKTTPKNLSRQIMTEQKSRVKVQVISMQPKRFLEQVQSPKLGSNLVQSLNYSSTNHLLGTIEKIYDESQQLTTEYRALETTLKQGKRERTYDQGGQYKSSLYKLSQQIFAATQDQKKIPQYKGKLCFNLRMNRLYPMSDIHRGSLY